MKIITLGDEVLHMQTSPVLDINEDVEQFALTMLDLMNRGKGIGLAAPQVGDLRRIFVCHINNDSPRIFINPTIIETSPEVVSYEEGCLSIPGIYEDLERPEFVRIQAWNLKGKPFTLDAEGLLARVIQHEYDHLNGILFIDRLPERKRERAIRQYERKDAGKARSRS